ncbi:MAG: hypothetical protein ACOX9R_04430 [Armatimonadota bacterium]
MWRFIEGFNHTVSAVLAGDILLSPFVGGVIVMNPSRALGTFLRRWRWEWAGLSRAQLALAVDAMCGHERVTEAVVRAWEKGQPPASTEELDGLLAVMRRHDMSEPEIGYVRRAVFAAVLDRHYPDLFIAEEFAQLPDVDELAEQSPGVWPRAPASQSPVELVARLDSLEREVGRDVEPARPGSQHRRQQVALALTRDTMRWYCEASCRPGLAAGHAAANLRFLEDCFGEGGIGSSLTPMMQRLSRIFDGAMCMQTTVPVADLLDLSRAAEERGNAWIASQIFVMAFMLIPAPASADLREALWPDVDRHLDSVGRDPATVAILLPGAVADGQWARAERLATELEPWRHGPPMLRQGWEADMAIFAFYRGDLDEAQEHLDACLSLSLEAGLLYNIIAMPALLRMCEEARKRARYDPDELWAEAEREAKQQMRYTLRWTGPRRG